MSDTPQPPKKSPNRKALGSDPTMPIKLDRTPLPVDPRAPTPLPFPAISEDAPPVARVDAPTEFIQLPKGADAAWIGNERTMIGAPAPVASAATVQDETRVWTGAEATLVGTPSSPSATRLPPATPAEVWQGSEQTLVGAAPASATVPATSSDEWTGSEATLVGSPTTGTSGPVAEWSGNDATVVGMATPLMVPPNADADEEWAGREATLLGVPAGATPKRQEGGTSHGSGTGGDSTRKTGTRPTSPTMDDGWHLKGRQGSLTGTNLGDYEIGGILGEGGMGVVYRGRQISLKRRCAVKVLPPNLAQDMSMRTRFEQEARTASLLQSPHVVQVYAAGAQDDIIYFVMEFVEGKDLSNIIHERAERSEAFTPEEAAGYIIQAARGLAEASKHNIVHRDIKPANLMITAKGVVKIADFGISKIAGEHNLTMTGTTVGTPAYCSPEQGRGDPVDPRADIYSLGVAFYELLAGQKPFEGSTPNALIYQHNYAEPKLPRDLRPEISEQYQAVCLKCLMKDPASRYQDASELVTDLERIRDGNMSLTAVFQAKFGTGADDAMIRMGLKRKYGWLPLAAAALFLVLAGGAGLWWWADRQDQASRATTIASERSLRRDRLAQLDQRAALRNDAADDLAWWGKNVDKDDDWKRWSAKVERVQSRRAAIEPIMSGDSHLPAQTRATATKEIEALRDDVGGEDADIQRWTRRLGDTDQLITATRAEIAPVFREAVLTAPKRNAAATKLALLEKLAGANDADVEAWTRRSSDLDKAIAERVKRLDRLASGNVTERDVSEIEGDLKAYGELVGSEDPKLQSARVRINGFRSRLEELRKELTSVVAPSANTSTNGVLTVSECERVDALLKDYRPLVDAGDGTLSAALSAKDRTQERIKNLDERLARLNQDQPAPLSKDEIDAFKREQGPLAMYAALVPTGDRKLIEWADRIRREEASITADLATVARFNEATEATIAQREAGEKALAGLDDRHAVGVELKLSTVARINADKVAEMQTRQVLTDRWTDSEAIGDNLVTTAFERLERIAANDDPLVRQWAPRLKDYKSLVVALKPLDEVAPVPDRARDNLTAFIKLTSANNNRAVAWSAKLDRIDNLRSALAPLDQVGPLPERALANAAELHDRQVGALDPQAVRWKTKAERVTALRADLGQLFERDARTNYVLANPESARHDVNELVANIGASELDVRRFDWREQTLRGPGKPAWAERAERDAFGVWAELAVANAKVRMRWIPAGVFTLGSPDTEAGREGDELLVPDVVVSRGFWLADSECTQELWQSVMGTNPSRFKGDDTSDRPVERVSWNDARQFCDALTARVQTDRNTVIIAQLPTEAEWEYACRAGSDKPFHGSEGGFEAKSAEGLAVIAWNSLKDGTRGVRRRDPNQLGLFDMHGNVWEWCRDKYGTYSSVEVVDPEGRQEDTRVIRGGSWGDPAQLLRAANRNSVPASMRTLFLGFRFAIKADWAAGKEPERPGAGL